MFECENEFSLVKFLAGSKGCAENLLLAECHIFLFLFSVIRAFKYLVLNCSLNYK